MDFQMGDTEFQPVALDEIISNMSETDNCTIDDQPTKLSTIAEVSSEQIMAEESLSDRKLEVPSASSSKSKHMTVNSETKSNKGIQEFVKILRPHLPRKSKSRAYKLLQSIAKGMVVESSFQRRIKKKRTRKLTYRKQTRNTKTKSQSGKRRSLRSLYGSSESCRSSASRPHCYSCCRITRY
ncbi:unnamed protein product [Spodoptera exigua]|uniref:Uncharacterized protein n=1 Tax=Spodoptera exigua TaxID=7107 RepID=A0A835G9V0_SPOEX|nr:hypothetical protein HW555_010457 [Spodoptera exigua]CAH0695708.1 unnamed protein product [Spodoptera exigua]